MKKAIPFFIVLALLALLPLHGCQAYDMYPISSETAKASAQAEHTPEEAVDEIYKNINLMGLNNITPEVLTDRFSVTTSYVDKIWGKYSDGRFGLSDVYIVKPVSGQADNVRRMLEDIKMLRTVEFRSYDIYNSLEIAEEGTIYEIGDYVVLLMLEDNEAAQAILADYLAIE